MPKSLLNRWHGLHIIWGFILMLLLTVALFLYQWVLGIIGFLLCGAVIYYTMLAEKAFRRELNNYLATLSHRVKRASREVVQEMPIGILLYNEEKIVEWHNPYISAMLERDSVIGDELAVLIPAYKDKKEKDDQFEFRLNKKVYRAAERPEERLLFITDITEYAMLSERYEEQQLAVGIVMFDNVEEATQGLDDQNRSMLLAKVISHITEWANKYNIFLRRIASDRYMILMDQRSLRELEQSRFEVLDEVRELTSDNKLALTLSIGIATRQKNLIELGNLAQSGLDIALGRGGDQCAVKDEDHTVFYGGKSNAVEKRTRVRARVISHALRDLIQESDRVVIMGHRMPDMDAVGAAIGVWKAAQTVAKDAYIVLEGINPSIDRMMQVIREQEQLHPWFVSPDDAAALITSRTLIVVVDTHKTSMLAEPRLLQNNQRVVVIDHHRRGEDFIHDTLLFYMEPYASSTCELVTELLQYFHEKLTMEPMEATALLAGIVVDTKSFSLRTGSRTFEAASFLRRNGGDSAIVQNLLKEDLEAYVQKAEIIKRAQVLYGHIAIAVTEPERKYPQLIIAQVADTLLNMTDIQASFVVSERPDGLIGISARSLGKINVQVIMEQLGGGGHLTNAAVQLEGSLKSAEENLLKALKAIQEEEGLLE